MTDTPQLATLLDSGIRQLQLELPVGSNERLLSYVTALQKWNSAYNLTAIRDPKDMVVKHLLDSLAVSPHVRSGSLLDVGTGAGLPGLVLAMVRPDLQVDLLDSNSKKTRFLVQMAAQFGLKNVKVHHARVEQAKLPPQAQIISRAFASLNDFAHWCGHLMADDGLLLAMKGLYPQDEIDALPAPFAVRETHVLTVPYLAEARHLVVIGKNA
ncbi:MAG: 16S rRNA (guanine(527)-N(7))-methyltransferase RsmG [Fluviicoccus sp.]|uniref:16S rRNA (guanine(527)-N(7))-methyltransferase RsmG n=1 Tax=Fluviicoccus sp. TaxID=2003552 RepID=UPI0027293AA0|nr:16S rRNA (guanine(527)-N(7))-methyltransferase RsmG [Fluviicoccus sp.]MDO8331032.1 16S rRNA (guanine(527)-N(7))-methyltransferase RsmG [Fluviicoccus sp.]